MKSKLSLFSLVMLIVSAIDSIRTLPTTAFFGSCLIFFFFISSLIFLIPIAFISAEFASRFPHEGGVFHWVRQAFGIRAGTLAVWLQWINTMVWYPTMLLFIAGTAAHLIDPELAKNKAFLLFVTLVTFWGLTFLNLKGIQVSARVNAVCGSIGTLLPMIFLIVLGFWWICTNKAQYLSFSTSELFPTFNLWDNGAVFVTIMASFLGMELAGVHINEIDQPQKNFPKAIGFSVFILLATLILGALAIGIVIPKNEIQFVDGIMQTFTKFLHVFHMPFLVPVLACLIIIGSTGGSINWLLSPAKGLLQAAEYGFLPPYFLSKNEHGVSVRILVFQAVLVSFFCFLIQLVPSINTFYWFLMALSTSLYMFMYMLLFFAALKLKRPKNCPYNIPKGLRTISCFLGLFACLLTIIFSFQPSPDIVIENRYSYSACIVLGFILLICPVAFFYRYQRRKLEREIA